MSEPHAESSLSAPQDSLDAATIERRRNYALIYKMLPPLLADEQEQGLAVAHLRTIAQNARSKSAAADALIDWMEHGKITITKEQEQALYNAPQSRRDALRTMISCGGVGLAAGYSLRHGVGVINAAQSPLNRFYHTTREEKREIEQKINSEGLQMVAGLLATLGLSIKAGADYSRQMENYATDYTPKNEEELRRQVLAQLRPLMRSLDESLQRCITPPAAARTRH